MTALHATSFPHAWKGDSIASLLTSPGSFAFMAIELSSLFAGFVLARAAADEAEILTIAISPSVRRRGIGRSLMIAAARHAQRLGARTLFLEVGEKNLPARGLYEGLGFAQSGQRKDYYPGEDALVLKAQLPLGGSPLGK